jgi:hypothetical protein
MHHLKLMLTAGGGESAAPRGPQAYAGCNGSYYYFLSLFIPPTTKCYFLTSQVPVQS